MAFFCSRRQAWRSRHRRAARSIATKKDLASGSWNANPVALPSASVVALQSTTESASPPVARTIGGVP